MLTALIILIISRIRKNRLLRKKLVVILLLIIPSIGIAQVIKYNYDVMKNGKKAGHITIQHTREGNRDIIELEAFVRANFLIGITIRNREKIIIDNGRIIHSRFFRSINNNNEAIRTLSYNNDQYTVESKGNLRALKEKEITGNMATLYLKEPISVTQIYSDAAEKFLLLKQVNPGVYEVILPDGGKNTYHFKNSICQKIEVKQKLFSAEIRLRSINNL